MKINFTQQRISLFILLITSFASFTSFCQVISKTRKVVPVMPQQTFYLNGGTRATFGGTSRVYYLIQLPKNTVEWYYTFTTSQGKTENGSLNLLPQLTRLLDPSGLTAIVTSSILSPTGAMVCNILLYIIRLKGKFQKWHCPGKGHHKWSMVFGI
jgi:hypothetical protein